MTAPILVLGATGTVGRGVVEAALAAGRPVIAVARNAGALRRLRAEHAGADLVVLPLTIAGEADGIELARRVRALQRPLAGVVAALSGDALRGRLLDQPVAELARKLDEDLMPHLAAARPLLRLLADAGRGGSYVMIGGPGSGCSWAGYGHRSITAAALRMLACVLHEEARPLAVRVQLLSVEAPVRSSCTAADACPQWPTARAVGDRALALVAPAGTGQPADAVVPFAGSTPRGDTSGGRMPANRTPTPTPTADPAAAPTPLLTSRCLQDARTLLRALISPNHNEAPRHGTSQRSSG